MNAMAVRISPSAGVAADGRARRGERSRDAIVRALHALVGEGVAQPTAQQVAERARVGLRSVFRHFDDMDSLWAEVSARVQAAAEPLLREPPEAGTLEERVRELVQHRSAFFEAIAPYKRAGNLARRRSVYLQRQHTRVVRELRERLLRALPELERAPAGVIEALDLVLSFDAWDRLRVDQKLSRERATEAVETAAVALLARPPRGPVTRAKGRKR
jgi:AcrR family transcriptional regulator